MTRTTTRPFNTVATRPPPGAWAWVTDVALVLVLAATVARALTPDALRDVWSASPGGDPADHGPGATTGLLLDLLAAVPALLVLVRRG